VVNAAVAAAVAAAAQETDKKMQEVTNGWKAILRSEDFMSRIICLADPLL
jgi:hypothetical protein